ncbi:MAG: hypothetical protein ACRDHG_01585 [Anaerolineales bacterium]
MTDHSRAAKRRPLLVTWLSLGVLTLAVFNLGGWLAGLSLPDLPYSVPRAYLLVRNALWAAWGVLSALLAFQGKPSAPGLLRVGGVLVLGWYWADRLLLARSDYTRNRWPLAAMFTVLAATTVVVILSRPNVRDYFQEKRS